MEAILVEDKPIKNKNAFIVYDIYWERVFLHFIIEPTGEEKKAVFKLQNLSTCETVTVESEENGKNQYHLCLNITAADVRSFLENGNWTIIYKLCENETYEKCFLSTKLGYRLDELTRVFRYGGEEFAYTINFSAVSDDQENLFLVLKSYFMKKNNKWRKRQLFYKSKAGKISQLFIKSFSILWILGINIWYRICGILRKRKKLYLLLMNETNKLNAGNLQMIDKRLKERKLDEVIHISYSFREAIGNKSSIFSWIKLITILAFQDIIILDNYAPVFSFLKLRKDVELIQVWHAGGGFKAVGYCRFGKDGSPFPEGSCHKSYTTAVTGSEHLIKVFEEVFGIEKEAFLPIGMPRLDGYLEFENIEKFRNQFYKKYKQFRNKKVILFAPTYRGTGQKDAYYDYDKIDLNQIYDVCGNEYVFLIKMHPFIKKHIEIPQNFQDKIFDFSDFPSINDLFYVTEILITDYSSNFYEFSLMKKPMLFYTYDRHIYELTRGVYRSVKGSAPGKVCDTFDELILSLKNKDFEYEKVEKFVKENFDQEIGNATDKLIDEVILKKHENKRNE